MHVDTALGAVRAARQLATRGDALAAAAVTGGSIDEVVRLAAADGAAAITALTDAGASSSAVADVQRAVDLLGTTPLGFSRARARGTDLASSAQRAIVSLDRDAPRDVRTALFDEIATRDAGSLDRFDRMRMATMLGRDRAGTVHPVPRTIPNVQPVDELLRAGEPDAAALDRYLRASRIAATPRDVLRSSAHELLATPADEFTQEQWQRFSALVDADADGSLLVGTNRHALFAHPRATVHALAAGTGAIDDNVRSLLRTARVHTTAPADLVARTHELTARNPESLTAAEWDELRLMLDSDPDGAILRGPRDLRGLDPLTTWLPDLAAGKAAKVHNALDRYFEAWRLVDATPEQLRATASDLAFRPADSLGRREWARLAAAIDMDPDGAIPRPTTTTIRDEPIGKWLAKLSLGDWKHRNGDLSAWMRELRIALEPDHPAKVDAAMEAVLAGRSTLEDARRIAGESARIAALTDTHSQLELLRVADELLQLDVVATTRGSRQALMLVDHALAQVDELPEQLHQVAKDTRELAKLNLQRLDEKIPNPGAPGVAYYPDYAELGRVRSNVHTMRSMLDPIPATQRPSAAAAADDAAAATTEPVVPKADGTLTW